MFHDIFVDNHVDWLDRALPCYLPVFKHRLDNRAGDGNRVKDVDIFLCNIF